MAKGRPDLGKWLSNESPDWTGRPTWRRLLVSILVGIPFVILTGWISHRNWHWMVLVGLLFPVGNWLGTVYQGWFGRRLGVDKPPPPLVWDDRPDEGVKDHPPLRYLGKGRLEGEEWWQERDGTWHREDQSSEEQPPR